MKIEDQSILLAPGSLHLALYEEIFRQKGNTLGINVMTPEAYINTQLSNPKENPLAVLYEYRRRLADLPRDNVFYDSRSDYAFLNACYEFMGWIQLLGLQSFPEQTPKDRDLKQVLERLWDIPLWQKEAAGLSFPDASSVSILECDYPEQTRYLLDGLLKQGAKWLHKEPQETQIEYWSASNPRKEMEVIADEIIDQQIPAESVFVALADSSQSRVLDQIFNARHIPHTFLHDPVPSQILKQFQIILQYVVHPTPEGLLEVLKALYFRQSADLRTYLELFPSGSDLRKLVYQENPILSAAEFEKLQSLEAQSEPWLPELQKIRSWDWNSMEEIATTIQEQNPNPTQEDVKTFEGILQAYSQIKDQIHNREDLELFERHLSQMHPSSVLHSMRGVLIGAPKEISPLRPVVFYAGADAAHFPEVQMHGGIFDEEYLQHTDFPPLQGRIEKQKEALYQRLKQPEKLFVLTPQSDYEGKTIETSFEMNTWLGRFPAFRRVDDTSVHQVPDFSLTLEDSTRLFAPHQVFSAGTRSLKSYEDCPLKHMLRFGLRLKIPYSFFDTLRVKTEVLPQILLLGHLQLGKSMQELTLTDVRQLVEMEFSFPRQVFAKDQAALRILQEEYTQKVWEMIQVLNTMNSQWNLQMNALDYPLHLEDSFEDFHIEIQGSMTPASKVPFSLYDPGSTPGLQPKASLALGLNLKPVEAKANAIAYGKGSSASVHPISHQESENSFMQDFLKTSVLAQDMEDVEGGFADVIKKKVPTYEQKEMDLKTTAENFLQSLQQGCIQPEHKKGACEYCPYRSICRNGAKERE